MEKIKRPIDRCIAEGESFVSALCSSNNKWIISNCTALKLLFCFEHNEDLFSGLISETSQYIQVKFQTTNNSGSFAQQINRK